MEKRGQFTFYRSYFEAVKELPEQMRLRVLMGLIGYGLDGLEPEGMEPIEQAIFLLIKPTLDAGRRMAQGGKKGQLTQRSRKGMPNEGEKEIEKEKEKENEIEDEGPGRACGFDSFWKKYPVKIDRDGARKAYLACGRDADQISAGLERWLGSRQWREQSGRFIPRAAKWLREKHYLQAPSQTVPCGASGELGQAEIEAIESALAEP